MKIRELYIYFKNDKAFITTVSKILIVCVALVGVTYWLYRENTNKQGILVKEQTEKQEKLAFITKAAIEEQEIAKLEQSGKIPIPINKDSLKNFSSDLSKKARESNLSLVRAQLGNVKNDYYIVAQLEGDWPTILRFLSALETSNKLGTVQQIKADSTKEKTLVEFKYKIYIQ